MRDGRPKARALDIGLVEPAVRGNAVQHWHRPAQDLRPPDFSGPGALKERMAWRVAFNADAEQARSGILNGKVDPMSNGAEYCPPIGVQSWV